MGVEIDKETGRPLFNTDTMETNVEGIYIAGVIAAGNNANEIFIENGRFHGGAIAAHLVRSKMTNRRHFQLSICGMMELEDLLAF